MEQMARAIERAQRLDPPALGEDATFGEAVRVLKRHAESVGIFDEVVEMTFEVVPPHADE